MYVDWYESFESERARPGMLAGGAEGLVAWRLTLGSTTGMAACDVIVTYNNRLNAITAQLS